MTVSVPYLMVAPYFPPMNYVGAKRALHFAVHLQTYGYRPVVIALDAEFEADPALLPLVPDVEIHRVLGAPRARKATTKKPRPRAMPERSEVMGPHIPRAVSRWARGINPFSFIHSLRLQAHGLQTLLDKYAATTAMAFPEVVWRTLAAKCRLVYATFGPPSGVLMATAIARLLQLPLVLDFRDPYTLEPNLRAGWSPEAVQQAEWIERWLFRSAKKVVLNTESALQMYRNHYSDEFPPERFGCIRNHFDPLLYAPGPEPPKPDSPFQILYYGHLRPSKNALLFANAYRAFISEANLTPDDTKLIMFGEITPEDQAEFTRLGLQSYVESHAWVPFTESTRVAGNAALLLDLMGPGHGAQISGKFYDYLAARRPILSVSPNRELDRIFKETGMGQRVDLNEAAIVGALWKRFLSHRAGEAFTPDEQAVNGFSAEFAAKKMAAIFDDALKN